MKSKYIEQQEFNLAMGSLDECISRVLLMSTLDIGEVNEQTLRHHADDMIGAGQKIISHLNRKNKVAEDALAARSDSVSGTAVASNPFAAKKAS